MSLSLKHIPCPAGNRCTAFQCIFGHEKDNLKIEEESISEPVKDEALLPSNQDRPSKRLKVDAEKPSLSSQTGVASTARTGPKPAEIQKQSLLQSVTRPISPPPLKRKATASTQSANTAATKNQQLATKPSASTSKAAAPAKPKKAESLNPRLLKSSPASHEIRLKLLRLLHQEFKRLNEELRKTVNDQEQKLLLSDQDLIIRALDEEQACAIEKPAVYSNVMKNKVMQYKRMTAAQWKEARVKEKQEAQKKLQKDNEVDGEPRKIETGLTHAQEVELLKRILTPLDNMGNHGYVPAVPTQEQIKSARDGMEAAKGWEKCDRCQQRFQVFPGRREEDGALTTGGACKFHWGKTYVPSKAPGDKTRVPKRYHCCGQEVGESAGCFTHEHHVFKASDAKRLAAVLNFAETPENPLAPTDRAVCFDCEMCYTVHGLELVRLTATSWPTGEDLLDVLVQPLGEILDLNSRFSGVWPDDLAAAESWSVNDDLKPAKDGNETGSEDGELKAKKKKLKIVSSPEVARDLLFSLISPTTPLIGHGLENDLNSVRIVHPTIIDSVLLYPHKMGLPYRHGLKTLMNVHMNRKIQQDTGPKMLGHDSGEDARAAGDLVRLRVMDVWNDMKRVGWRVVDGEITPPEGEGGGLTEAFIEGRNTNFKLA
ncbi:exonuclease [Trichoderma guizhouense]|uniref:Exonuclease n=1 Tax=Trichoderma guizhouense TaxID=1491466 RepID=A0A1T3CSG4_9HYPO|nr:exonuclease [Trichoderma guizhouense]